MFVLVGLTLAALVLVFGFSVNGKLGSSTIDFSINGAPRYETVSVEGELLLLDTRTGEMKLVKSGLGRQLGQTFPKMAAEPSAWLKEDLLQREERR